MLHKDGIRSLLRLGDSSVRQRRSCLPLLCLNSLFFQGRKTWTWTCSPARKDFNIHWISWRFFASSKSTNPGQSDRFFYPITLSWDWAQTLSWKNKQILCQMTLSGLHWKEGAEEINDAYISSNNWSFERPVSGLLWFAHPFKRRQMSWGFTGEGKAACEQKG